MSKKVVPKQEEKLQAVVIADSFNTRFTPITLTKPRVLLPLVNRPMLDYTLEFLSHSGIHETFVFCCSHSQQIRDFISKQWPSSRCSMQISVISSETFQSMGDILRDLDAKALIRNDFVLLYGDCIANVSLKDAFAQHKKNRQLDKGCVMTSILRKAVPLHRTRSIEDDSVYVLDAATNQILHCEKVPHYTKFIAPLSIFQSKSRVSVNYNLQETHISICSVNMPLVFSDNCDYETRDDFIHGILGDEITGNSVYVHIIDKGYAARIVNIATYDRISKDILQRLTFPTVPDVQTKSSYQRHNIYKQSGVHLAIDSIIKQNVAIGSNTSIGNKSIITNSVIGSNCKIGDFVTIQDSYIWDNVIIESHCNLKTCIIADNVNLKSKVNINSGCIISYNVIIGPNVDVKENSMIYFDSDNEDNKIDTKILGSDGRGQLYQIEDDPDYDDDDNIAQDVWPETNENESDKWSTSTTFSENSSDDERTNTPLRDEVKVFYEEVVENFQAGIQDKTDCEILILEVNSRKFAYNVSMNELITLIIKAILDLPNSTKKFTNGSNYFSVLLPSLTHLTPLIQNYVKSQESQRDCIIAIEEYCLLNQENINAATLTKVLKYLYDKDILDEDVIVNWFEKPKPISEVGPSEQEELRKQQSLRMFINWLKEAEEESSSE